MKIVLPLILLGAFALNGCTTLANRRDLYWPDKAVGPWNDKLDQNTQVYNDSAVAHNRIKNH